MVRRIAVETGLDNVAAELRQRGFETVELQADSFSWDNVQAAVVSGMDTNLMGIEDTAAVVPVISADGLSVDEVVDIIERRAHGRT